MTAVPWVINSHLSDMLEKAASVRIFLAELTYKLRALLLGTACSPTLQPQPSLSLYNVTVRYETVFMGIRSALQMVGN